MIQPTIIKSRIETVEDFPKAGIRFYDIAPLLADSALFATVIRDMAEPLRGNVDKLAGLEARGLLFAGALAMELGVGSFMLRKPGKLPGTTLHQFYGLEYGNDVLEMQADACQTGERVALVDDVIATGGTARAGVKLIRQTGAEVVALCGLIDLPELGGSALIRSDKIAVYSQVSYGQGSNGAL